MRLVAAQPAGCDPKTVTHYVDLRDAGVDLLERERRPWVPEPGMWLQFDWGEGPRFGRRRTQLFCAWLAWSRFRVVIRQELTNAGRAASIPAWL